MSLSYAKVKFRKHKFLLLVSALLVSIFYFTYQNSQHLALREKLQGPDVSDDSLVFADPNAVVGQKPIEDNPDGSSSGAFKDHNEGSFGDSDKDTDVSTDTADADGNVKIDPQQTVVAAVVPDIGDSRNDKGYKVLAKPPVSLPRKFHFQPDRLEMYLLPKIDYSQAKYNKIQSSTFEENGGAADNAKLAKIRETFMQSWSNYKKYAIDNDELLPLTNEGKDPFVGWSITLLDTLDTLHLMGLEEEFQYAVKKVSTMDFRRAPREYIPVFETVIRALGGLISAYDVSGEKVLLDKSIECGDMLIGIFDTPNNMPLLYYRWSDDDTKMPKFASRKGSVAEFGTLLLEYTRLAQITGNDTYFHYVHKITVEVEKFIAKEKELRPAFVLNGLLPTHMDLTGCDIVRNEEAVRKEEQQRQQQQSGGNSKYMDALYQAQPILCEKVGIHPTYSPVQSYTLGGLADSFYEYLIKQYHLLNGSLKQYLDMFQVSAGKIQKYMLFKAKLPSILVTESNTVPHLKTDPDDVVFLSELISDEARGHQIKQKTWVTHLSCFAGGMFGMAAKIGDSDTAEEYLKLGKQVTNGCYKIYELMELMPEWSIVERCPEGTNEDDPECQFDIKERIKQIRRKTEGLEESDFKSDADLLKGLEVRKSVPGESKQLFSGDTSEQHSRYLNVDEKNFAQFSFGPGSEKYDTTKTKKFPKKEKPNFKIHFPTTGSDTPNELIYKTSKGNVFWPVDKNFNMPFWANNMEGKFILRPELIESVFYMYRITGDLEWREKGWKLFESTLKHASIKDGVSALKDVTHLYMPSGVKNEGNHKNSLESFWFAETLKYYYLLFAEKDVWSLDKYVFNTEAHPFKRANKVTT